MNQLTDYITDYQELLFWLGFLFFNFILFAFNYFINIKDAGFFPFRTILIGGRRGIFLSTNADFFRFSIDISILILLVRYGLLTSSFGPIVFYFGFLLVFNVYHYSFHKIYEVNPVILNDLKLLKNGAGILWNESKLKLFLGVMGLIGIAIILCMLFSSFLEFTSSQTPGSITNIISAFVLLIFITALARKGYHHKSETYHRYLIHALRLGRHLAESIRLIKTRNKFSTEKLDKYRCIDFNLKAKPNIYFLFIESYGSLLLTNPDLSSFYIPRYEDFTKSLSTHGWGCRTNLSTSVSLIGPSWNAYTSVLLGHKIDSNFYYEYLLNEKRFYGYDTLMNLYQRQGYKSVNLNGSKFMSGVNVPLKQMEQFYGIDKYILENDLPYQGTRYGFTEGPPDQYVLNYAYENFLREMKPFVLFYLTKNSHSPFETPDFTRDWKDLDDTENKLQGNKFLQNPNIRQYQKAINYQLDFLQDFIIRNGTSNDIFLLLGDHQPHAISKQSDGVDTIFHIISQNKSFLSEFEEYGFSDSIKDLSSPIKHEAFFSIYIRSFLKHFGVSNSKLPGYEPEGLKF